MIKNFLENNYLKKECKHVEKYSQEEFKYGIHYFNLIIKNDSKNDYNEFFNFLNKYKKNCDFFVYTSIFDKCNRYNDNNDNNKYKKNYKTYKNELLNKINNKLFLK